MGKKKQKVLWESTRVRYNCVGVHLEAIVVVKTEGLLDLYSWIQLKL